jgi:hypothetical protein
MIPSADITSIRSPAPAAASTPSSATANAAQEALSNLTLSNLTLSNLTQNAVGKLFQAQILSQLDDGTFLVSVAQSALRMALPAGTTVGDTLEMTLLATDPRPAFLLEQQGGGSSASLSSAAKLIDTVLQTAQQAGAPATLVGKVPLVASPAVSSPELATALKDSVEFSGVFYESHVSQWVGGERPLSDLLREPQVQTQLQTQEQTQQQTQVQAPTQTSGKTSAGSAGTVLQRPPATKAELTTLMSNVRNAADLRPSLAQALNAMVNGNNLPKDADTVVRSATITQENAQTINLQLNTLEQHRIAWQGELWPGQRMEWEISEESNNRSQSGDADENQTSWQSVVRFDLPNLGKISASIHLAGGHVRMQVSTTTAHSAAALKAHGDDLANALNAAGSPLDSLTIKQDGQA